MEFDILRAYWGQEEGSRSNIFPYDHPPIWGKVLTIFSYLVGKLNSFLTCKLVPKGWTEIFIPEIHKPDL